MNDPAATAPESAGTLDEGEWVTPAVSYVNPVRRSCAFCGRPIARRYWRVSRGGQERIYCDPAHARLDTTYPVSLQRQTTAPDDER
jgi:hypothetical protein